MCLMLVRPLFQMNGFIYSTKIKKGKNSTIYLFTSSFINLFQDLHYVPAYCTQIPILDTQGITMNNRDLVS